MVRRSCKGLLSIGLNGFFNIALRPAFNCFGRLADYIFLATTSSFLTNFCRPDLLETACMGLLPIFILADYSRMLLYDAALPVKFINCYISGSKSCSRSVGLVPMEVLEISLDGATR